MPWNCSGEEVEEKSEQNAEQRALTDKTSRRLITEGGRERERQRERETDHGIFRGGRCTEKSEERTRKIGLNVTLEKGVWPPLSVDVGHLSCRCNQVVIDSG